MTPASDRRPCRCGRIGSCRLCYLAKTSREYQILWGIIPPCPFLGPVVEAAVCDCANAEDKHIRVCEHPKADHGRCTRGPNNGQDPDITSCLTCSIRPLTLPIV